MLYKYELLKLKSFHVIDIWWLVKRKRGILWGLNAKVSVIREASDDYTSLMLLIARPYISNKLVIANTFFKSTERKMYTWKKLGDVNRC